MFSLGKSASKSPSFYRKGRRSGQRAEQKYRPRLERLEGRALPSVTRLAIDIPVVETVGNLSVNFSLVVRIDFINYSMFGGSSGGGAGFHNTGSVIARPAATSQTPAAAVTSSVNQAATVAPDALQVAAVPTATSAASLASFTSASSTNTAAATAASANVASRPLIARPSLPELRFSQATTVSVATDPSLLLTPALPQDFNRILAPELKLLTPISPPVQAIVNRMEFIGGSVSSSDYATTEAADAPLFPAPPPQPVMPPPVDLRELAPTADAVEAALANDAWLIEKTDLGMVCSQESDSQALLTPELVSEVAALAVGIAGFSVGSPADYFPGRQVQRRLELRTQANKWKNLLWGQKP
jgi:hypothetical protein